MELVCRLLAGKGHGSLQIYCSQFCGDQILCQSHGLYSWDLAEHLCFVNHCNFITLGRFKHSWLATVADIWNELPADLMLQGESSGWYTILKDMQHCVATYVLDLYHMYVYEVYYSKPSPE